MGTRGHSYDHPLMKGRRGREVDCLAAGHCLALGGAGEDPFEGGYVQWQSSKKTKRGVFSTQDADGIESGEEVERGMIRVVGQELAGDFSSGM